MSTDNVAANDTVTVSSYNGGPTELDKDVTAFINEQVKEFKASDDADLDRVLDAAPGDAPADGDGVDLRDSADGKGPDGTTNPETAVTSGKPAEDVSTKRLVEREVAVTLKERELEEKMRQYGALEARLKEMEARVIPDNFKELWENKPEDAMKAMGLDPENVVRMVIANRLGDKADPQIKRVIEESKIKKEINDLKAELSRRDQAAKAQAFVAKVENDARQYVEKGIGEHAPTVAAVAKANPTKVFREIMDEISKDAQDKMVRGVGGDVLSYDEAAKRVEARWAEFKTIFTPPAAPQPDPASMKTQPKIVEAKKETTSIKSPDKPLAPWLRRNDVDMEGIKAGIAEFRRAEGTK